MAIQQSAGLAEKREEIFAHYSIIGRRDARRPHRQDACATLLTRSVICRLLRFMGSCNHFDFYVGASG